MNILLLLGLGSLILLYVDTILGLFGFNGLLIGIMLSIMMLSSTHRDKNFSVILVCLSLLLVLHDIINYNFVGLGLLEVLVVFTAYHLLSKVTLFRHTLFKVFALFVLLVLVKLFIVMLSLGAFPPSNLVLIATIQSGAVAVIAFLLTFSIVKRYV